MSEASAQEIAINKSSQVPTIESDQAVSLLLPFNQVKPLIEGYPAPKRPNRNRPTDIDDAELREECAAWDAASDEAFEAMENDLPE